MAGQGIDRREMLRALALAAAASRFPGFSRWVFAHDHARAPGGLVNLQAGSYVPQFFSAHEYATVARLAELIIPSDGSPGAAEAGASEFIDFMAASDPKIQFRFRYGLAWLDAHAMRLDGRAFVELAAGQQNAILEHLAYRDRYRPREDEGRAFFNLVREYTIMGFYTSRVGLEELDYPGLQFYAESPECPHTDDPEHRLLGATGAGSS
ncbi:MAG: gluconate 2-dehydrogenase subunit 3 family protein [Acidobacteria bacterium]|nr:gluconate 2-dehydrogenase subunit 3 family protein [Acidobacteriota bacterium]